MLTTLVALTLSQSLPAANREARLLRCGTAIVNFQGAGERLQVDGNLVDAEWSDEGRDAIFIGGGVGENARHHFEILPTGGYQLDGDDCRPLVDQ